MKMRLVLVLLLLLLLAAPLAAQPDYSKLPTLPVWYELNDTGYGQAMTYLPNFDTARKGFNALAQYISENTSPTWYNRFQGDTENMFEWGKRVLVSHRGDFDGNGIVDFYDEGRGMIYRGVENGKPPLLPAVAQYNVIHPVMQHSIIADFNNDGKDDALIRASNTPENSKVIGSILLGNTDLTKMQLIPLPHTSKTDTIECIIDAFAKGDGTGRIVTLRWDVERRNSTFVLWKLSFVNNGGNLTPRYEYLTQWVVKTSVDDGSVATGILVFNNTPANKHILLWHNDIIALNNDTFNPTGRTTVGFPYADLTTAKEDSNRWASYGVERDSAGNIVSLNVVFAYGDPKRSPDPYAKVGYGLVGAGSIRSLCPVGDVNGDGFADIAAYYSGLVNDVERNRFIIYLGISETVGVIETGEPNKNPAFELIVSNPIKRNSPLRLTLRSARESHLELYALSGGKIAELWRGATGGEMRTLELTLPSLAPGLYNLRLTDGRTTLDKALLITE
jgi:hypothetical protein